LISHGSVKMPSVNEASVQDQQCICFLLCTWNAHHVWLRRKDASLRMCGDWHFAAFCARYSTRLALVSQKRLEFNECGIVYFIPLVLFSLLCDALWCCPSVNC
jgi:hypothetical protein